MERLFPNGTKVPFGNDPETNQMVEENKNNLDKGYVEAGTKILNEPSGNGSMVTTTLTYGFGQGVSADKLRFTGWSENVDFDKKEPQEDNPSVEGKLSVPIPLDNATPSAPVTTTTVGPTTTNTQAGRQINRSVDFIPASPQMAPNGVAAVDAIAAQVPRARTVTNNVGYGAGDMSGGVGIGVTTSRTTSATVVIDILTQSLPNSPTSLGANSGAALQTQRYNAIRTQLISDGVPAGSIQRGQTLYGQPTSAMGGGANLIRFTITPNTTRNRTTTISNTR